MDPKLLTEMLDLTYTANNTTDANPVVCSVEGKMSSLGLLNGLLVSMGVDPVRAVFEVDEGQPDRLARFE